VSFNDTLVTVSLLLWIVVSAGLLLSLVVLVPRLARGLRAIEAVQHVFSQKFLPILERSDRLLDQASQAVTTLSADVEVVDQTVIRAAESVERIIELAEERVSEVNALVEVAVEEAEETFLSTAALLRALRIGGKKRKRRKLLRGERRRFG
jgi:hypothetical protein